MVMQKYPSGKFIGEYIKSCEANEQPLNKCQIGLLEQAVIEHFNEKPILFSIFIKEFFSFLVIRHVLRLCDPAFWVGAIAREGASGNPRLP